jgi:hypothetical protein
MFVESLYLFFQQVSSATSRNVRTSGQKGFVCLRACAVPAKRKMRLGIFSAGYGGIGR